MKCSSCGSSNVEIGHGDGDLLCAACDDMREAAVQRERYLLAAWWTPERVQANAYAMAGYGSGAGPLPRRIFP